MSCDGLKCRTCESRKRKSVTTDVAVNIKRPREIALHENKLQYKSKYYAFLDVCVQLMENDEPCAILLLAWPDVFDTNLLTDRRIPNIFRSCCDLLSMIYRANICDLELISRILRCRHLIMNKIAAFPSERRLTSREMPPKRIITDFFGGRLWPYIRWEADYFSLNLNYSVRQGYFGFLQFLIKYRKCNTLPSARQEIEDGVKDFLCWMKKKVIDYAIENNHAPRWRTFMPYSKEHMIDFFHCLYEKLSRRRTMFIILAMNVLADFEETERKKNNPSYFADTGDLPIKCLKLVNQLLPEPFITYQDIKTFVTSFVKPYPLFRKDSKIIYTCLWDYLKKLLPKSTEFYNPRSLKDLARCKIRECIPNGNFPEQVSKLLKPISLRNFILFDSETVENDFREDGMPQIRNLKKYRNFERRLHAPFEGEHFERADGQRGDRLVLLSLRANRDRHMRVIITQ